MLARERAAEFEHEIGDFVGNGFELANAVGGLHVDDRPHMQAADGGVGIDAGGGLVLRGRLPESAR